MKSFIAFASLLAVASASLVAPLGPLYGGPQHLPVIGPNGVPIDTPEVQQAKAVHLAHKVEAHARNGDLALGVIAQSPIASIASASYAPLYSGPQHLPVIGPNGVPIDTPAVQSARAAHLAQKVEAHARNGDLAVVAQAPLAIASPAPLARAIAPLAISHGIVPAVSTYAAGWTQGLQGAWAQPAAYPTTAVLPAAINGVPLETPEVVAAKTKHFAAHAEALARTGHYAGIHHLVRRNILAAPLAYSAPWVSSYAYGAPLAATAYATPYSWGARRLAYSNFF